MMEEVVTASLSAVCRLSRSLRRMRWRSPREEAKASSSASSKVNSRVTVGRFRRLARRDAVGLEQSLCLDELERIERGHVALRLAESEVSKLGRQVLAGHAVLLR